MIITVLSCSKNEDTFYPFYCLMERYWPNHPEIVYFTNGIVNPFYKTIVVPCELLDWTRGFREFLKLIEDDQVLMMIDDCFIRQPVDTERIEEASRILKGNIALMNFEKSWDPADELTGIDGWKKRQHGSSFEVSLMCGLWDKNKLLDVIKRDCDPWTIELVQDNCGYDYYINSGDYIIDWGYKTFRPCGIVKGKWTRECMDYLTSEGFNIDFNQRGYIKNS